MKGFHGDFYFLCTIKLFNCHRYQKNLKLPWKSFFCLGNIFFYIQSNFIFYSLDFLYVLLKYLLWTKTTQVQNSSGNVCFYVKYVFLNTCNIQALRIRISNLLMTRRSRMSDGVCSSGLIRPNLDFIMEKAMVYYNKN